MTNPDYSNYDGPLESKYRDAMRSMADYLDRYFNGPDRETPRDTGFVLITFEFGEEGRCNYISNAKRSDVVQLLKEQIARFEGHG